MNRRQFLQRLMMTPAILPFIPKGLKLAEPEVKLPEVPRQPLHFAASRVMSASAVCFTIISNETSLFVPVGNSYGYNDYIPKEEDTHTDLYYDGYRDDLKDRIKFRTEWLKTNKPNLP